MAPNSKIHSIDLALRTIARRRAELDSEEARWLREAEAIRIWVVFGMGSMLDYMERVLGYTPRVALERLRVAHALAELPGLAQALTTGQLCFTAVRELTRIATPETEREWRDDARGKNLRQIEELVATRKRGDRPTDPGNPDLRPRVVRFKIRPETYARLRAAQAALADRHGQILDDDQLVAALCGSVLDERVGDAGATGRSAHQLATVVCEACNQGWQTAAGVTVAVGAAVVERVRCDAQEVGSLHADAPERAVQTVPPATRRLVWLRDRGKCSVPGCRSATFVDVHHIVPKSRGGDHAPSNIALLCDSHHRAHHEGRLPISGTAPAHLVFGASAVPVRTPTRLDTAVLREQAKSALVNMGWKPAVARMAVDQALSETHVGTETAVIDVIREALRRCPTA